ncbi:aminodeoxychorismate synthase component I [Dongia deserti]|uniref:aminodeoxychorismate synthase component I n=1 Tax=Dongia deserti TaxID=2268030 RepID=UPI000E64753F|nr:aminodeoxychorismate synthase component I [Dongia deserti]
MKTKLIAQELSSGELPPDPVAWCRAFADRPGLALFDSALKDERLGRYSFLGIDPFARVEADRAGVRLNGAEIGSDPFAVIGELFERYSVEHRPDLPPFQTGLAGYFGYGLRHHVEQVPAHGRSDITWPDLMLGLYDLVLAVDHVEGRAWLLASGYPETSPAARHERAEARIGWARERLRRTSHTSPAASWAIAAKPDLAPAEFKQAVRRTIDYIEAGDIYQANITQRFRARLPSGFDRLSLYQALRTRNPATFSAYLDFGATGILSSSPERFLKVSDRRVETRPIKGTRPRGRGPAEDKALAAELLASAKDRAENLMIVDLLRNDISRVCRIGSVKVPTLFGLESYATVHHLVSVVTGELAEGRSAADLLRACFPGGSVTGAPKIRAMEIIAELEPTSRGPYCGSIGYLSADGGMDSNIVIRTYCIQGQDLTLQVGGGIVADSDPQAEYEESLAKAKALIEVLAQGGVQPAHGSAA